MAQVTPGMRREFGPMVGMVPAQVIKSISDEELGDRLAQARSLVQKSQAARTADDRKRLGEQAQAVLRARPRAEVERLVTDKIAKAAVTPDRGQADELRQQARQLLLQEPPAMRRSALRGAAVAKAKATDNGLMVCYDAAGRPFGVCRVDALTPVMDPGDMDEVMKARRQASRPRAGR